MSLLFNTLSRFLIAFLPRSKCLHISLLQSLSAVILEPKKNSVTTSTFSLSFCQCFVSVQFISVQSLSRVWLFVIPWTAAHQASLSITSSWNLPKLMSIESVMPSNHLILCHPLLLPPSIFPSIRGFSKESALRIRWPQYWSFSFNISPSNEHPGLISFRMDLLALLVVQGTLKSQILLNESLSFAKNCMCTIIFTTWEFYWKTIIIALSWRQL